MEDEFKLKKPLTQSGIGKRYYPTTLVNTLEAAEELLYSTATQPRPQPMRRSRPWKPQPGAENLPAERILESVRLEDVAARYMQLRAHGKEMKGCCPLHEDKTPSFQINTDKQLFYCFGCHEGGNVINFIMKIEHIGFRDAIALLGERYSIRS